MNPFSPGMNLIPGGGSGSNRFGLPHLWHLTRGLPERVAAEPGRPFVSHAYLRQHLPLPELGESSLQHVQSS